MKILDLYRKVAGRLREEAIPDADLEAAILLGHFLKLDRARIFLQGRDLVPPDVAAQIEQGLVRRLNREPLAYILGEKEFWSRSFRVTPAVLIPRPETELLIETAIAALQGCNTSNLSILDLGTGSGVIAVIMALELPGSHVCAVDYSLAALKIARFNARRYQVLDRLQFINASWFAGIRPGPLFDLLITNPPYIDSRTMHLLQPEIGFEPRRALDGGKQGMEAIEIISRKCRLVLKPDAWFFMEIGADQAGPVTDCFSRGPWYEDLKVYKDLAGRPRIFQARRK